MHLSGQNYTQLRHASVLLKLHQLFVTQLWPQILTVDAIQLRIWAKMIGSLANSD